jgi:hypothetical protein
MDYRSKLWREILLLSQPGPFISIDILFNKADEESLAEREEREFFMRLSSRDDKAVHCTVYNLSIMSLHQLDYSFVGRIWNNADFAAWQMDFGMRNQINAWHPTHN